MKFNISYPATGAIKSVVIDDEKKLRPFYDRRVSQEVDGSSLGDEFKGYVFKITGGNDKQGFPMMQGVLVNGRVRLLLKDGHPCYRPRREGERKRKSVRGCIVGPDMSAINLVIVKKGDGELPDLTDKYVPRRLGPKRASKIRKLFNLSKEDDVRKYVIRRELPAKEKNGKTIKRSKAPKIQRLITPERISAKKAAITQKKERAQQRVSQAASYARLLAKRKKEQRDRRASQIAKRRASSKGSLKRSSTSSLKESAAKKVKTDNGSAKPAAAAKPVAAKPAAVKKPADKKPVVKAAAKVAKPAAAKSKTVAPKK